MLKLHLILVMINFKIGIDIKKRNSNTNFLIELKIHFNVISMLGQSRAYTKIYLGKVERSRRPHCRLIYIESGVHCRLATNYLCQRPYSLHFRIQLS